MTSTQSTPTGRAGSRRGGVGPAVSAVAGTGVAGSAVLSGVDDVPPSEPGGTLTLRAPPRLQPGEGPAGVLVNVIPMLGGLGAVLVVATMSRSGGGGARGFVAGGLFLLATLGFVAIQLDRQRRQRGRQVGAPRVDYLRHLDAVRAEVRDVARRQREAATWRHPDPRALPGLVQDRGRAWGWGATGRPTARWGRTDQPLALDLVEPDEADAEDADPVCVAALRRLVGVHRVQRDLPAAVDLAAFTHVEVCGEAGPARALARALVCSASASTPPDDLVVAVLADPRHLAEWDWVKWLPHAASATRRDAVGPRRLVAASAAELADLLPPAADGGPHLLLVTEGDGTDLGVSGSVLAGRPGLTVLDLPARWADLEDGPRLRLLLDETGDDGGADAAVGAVALRVRAEPVRGRADQCDPATAEALARRLAPLGPAARTRDRSVAGTPSAGADEVTGSADLGLLLGLELPAEGPPPLWLPRPAREELRVPMGLGVDGAPVHLDLKEAALQGMGPHGLVIGATGSGKSEFLRTLVLGLALTHPPERLNLVLVDFKGGATFADLARLPHTSAVITNLADELDLVDRMADALSGEMLRRQELLRDAGNLASVRDFERARAAGATGPTGEPLPALPSLLVVVDEFSELLTARPELVDLFVAIGRLGRSLGLHLLLASQRLEEGRLRGLESHLSYRVGLRTFSAQESRAVLGVPDAYELPGDPGVGYLRPDPTTLTRFRAAYVSGPPAHRPPPTSLQRDDDGHVHGVWPFTVGEVRALDPSGPPPAAPVAPVTPEPTDPGDGPTLLDLAVDGLAGRGTPAHRVWLPPLDRPDTLDTLAPDLVEDPVLGLVSPGWRAHGGGLVVPVGAVDRPREQRRDTLALDLSGAGGHVAVIGGPRTGKSTLLRTLVTSLALVSTPAETQVFVLDFGGGTFTPLDDLPHVSGVATRTEPDVVRRVVAEVHGVLERREAFFRAEGVDSVETYRRRLREAGGTGWGDGWGEVYLVVDGWSLLRTDYEDLEHRIQQLAARGLGFGVHLVVGAARWADLRAATRDLLGTRVELRLGDALDSEIDRRLAATVPADRPGRGLSDDRHHVLAALPRIDGVDDPATLGAGVGDLVRRVAAAWPGAPGPRLRLLPHHLELSDVRRRAGVGDRAADPDAEPLGGPLLLGVDESHLAPVGLDPEREPMLLVLGDGGSGKSAVLRTHVREVVRTRPGRHAQLVVLDYRRSLLGEVPEEHLLNYLTSTAQATPVLADLARYLESRLPGPDVTPEQLRSRTWWRGAEVFVVVDDYDLVSTSASSPLAPLVPLLPQARDVGLHLVVARRSGGASRALYDPVLQALRDLAMPGLMLSGSPDEGPLLGNLRPTPLPPGRGRLLTRDRGVEVVQTAWTDPVV